jgi:dolichol-phosphate mannosyltransferase
MSKRLVIIPTYNEAKNAPSLITRLFKYIPNVSILVVDDGSPDGTASLCLKISNEFPNLYVINRGAKLGFASAYISGFRWALNHGFDEICQMDADLSHRVRDLAKMLESKNQNPGIDLVIGSRWITGGATENWPLRRQLLSRSANLYVRMMLGMGIADATGGFRIYSSHLLRRIDLDSITSDGYAFQIEMTRAAKRAGAKILEVPIIFRERESGVSKMSRDIVREAMTLVTVWGIRRFLRLK